MFKVVCVETLSPPKYSNCLKDDTYLRSLDEDDRLRATEEACAYRSVQRILKPRTKFMLTSDYEFDKEGKLKAINGHRLDDSFFSKKGPNVQISAIVGENGMGKSSLIDMMLRVFNNASYALRERTLWNLNYQLCFVPFVFCKVFFVIEEDSKEVVYYLQQEDNILKLIKQGERVIFRYDHSQRHTMSHGLTGVDVITAEGRKNILEKFFYTIVVNYSLHSYNSTEYAAEYTGSTQDINPNGNHIWIDSLFHKNDSYQTPIVLNPFRNQGVIDNNLENNLIKDRLYYLLLNGDKPLERILHNKHVRSFLFDININYSTLPNRKYDSVELMRIIRQIIPEQNLYSSNISECIVLAWSRCLGFDLSASGLTSSNDYKRALNYLIYKTIKICLTYEEYKPYKADVAQCNVADYIKKLYDDGSHITSKIRRVVVWCIFQHYGTEMHGDDIIRSNEISQSALINRINSIYGKAKLKARIDELRRKYPIEGRYSLSVMNLTRYDYFPSSPFVCEIVMNDSSDSEMPIFYSTLSSGEKQMVSTVSTILYHVRNLESVWRSGSSNRVRYSYVNLIVDEVELYFHPKYQTMLVNYLIEQVQNLRLRHIKGINVIFCTHSPFILSDVPQCNVLYLEDGKPADGRTKVHNTFCANVYDILASRFFMTQFVGDFASRKLDEIVCQINNIDHYKHISTKRRKAVEIMEQVNLIGDDFIRENLKERLLPYTMSVDEKKKRYKELETELNKLKKELGDI